MIFNAEILVSIDAATEADAERMAEAVVEQVELRLGPGPHSIAPWRRGIDAVVAKASVEVVIPKRPVPVE